MLTPAPLNAAEIRFFIKAVLWGLRKTYGGTFINTQTLKANQKID